MDPNFFWGQELFTSSLLFFILFLAVPHGVWDLSSPIRDWIHAPCIWKHSLNHWTTRNQFFFMASTLLQELQKLPRKWNTKREMVSNTRTGDDSNSTLTIFVQITLKKKKKKEISFNFEVLYIFTAYASCIPKAPCINSRDTTFTYCSEECFHHPPFLLRFGKSSGRNPRYGGAWWAAIYGVTQSRTWLKRLSSSSDLAAAAGRKVETATSVRVHKMESDEWSALLT